MKKRERERERERDGEREREAVLICLDKILMYVQERPISIKICPPNYFLIR